MTPDAVADFRREYRATISRFYSGVVHFLFTTLGTLAALVFAATHVRHVRPVEWLAIPVAFVFANFAEYRAHRGPMHNAARPRWNPIGILYKRHTGQHHRFYTSDTMAAESTRDLQMVLFPPVMLVFFIGMILVPLGFAIHFLVGANVAWLFAATGLAYYLTYEWLHLAYHLPETSRIGRLPFMKALKQHHQTHHDTRLMSKWNFNITFPIFDTIHGTTHHD